MQQLLDIIALLLLSCAVAAFVAGVYMMVQHNDFFAIFLLATGAVLLRSSVDLLRPRSAQ